MAQKFLGFPLSDELAARVDEVVQDIKGSEDKRQYALKAFQVVSDLSDVGLNYFFIETLKKAGLGKIKMMAVEGAIKTGKRAILTVGKRIIKGMSNEQLLVIAETFEESMTVRPAEA
ncbi:MAG: hypothetical protein GY810_21320 [Aureispira sp.]|nr:hypothetical protein [Aureispira sp.]